MPKPIIHGRDHAPGGADPIPFTPGGIQFDTYPQDGQWLYIETAGTDTSPSGFGVEIYDPSGNGINLGASGGGDIELRATGGGATRIRSTDQVDVHDENTTPGGGGVDIQSLRSDVTIRTGHYFTGLVGYLILTGLPTSDPGVTGAVWNDSGTLKIS
jgi:hypothetical protein